MKIIGVDTGGTFTDIVLVDNGEITVNKVPSTPENPSKAILSGISEITEDKDLLNVVHGTTVGTNAFLEKKGVEIALLTTKGFEDVIFIKRGNRSELYNINIEQRESLIKKENIFGVDERVNSKKEIIKKVEKKELQAIIDKIKSKNINNVAVAFLFSFFENENELLAEKLLNQNDINVHISSKVCPEYREFERTSTTIINAYLSPVLVKYLENLEANIKGELVVMNSAGGLLTPDEAGRFAIKTLLSGPAGGVSGAFFISQKCGFDKIITLDMGGTSTDVALCDGKIITRYETVLDQMPIKTPMIDIHTIGAGGGSIAYIDAGGALCVGPESAGAYPGPLCYDRTDKADSITVTDANLFLGRLLEDNFLGGKMKLNKLKLNKFFNDLSGKAGITPNELARGIIEIAELKMEGAIKVISVERGYDVRDFSLVSFGGAGGLHACPIARRMGIPRVIVPINPGLLSAMGMLLADIQLDNSRTCLLSANETKTIEKIFSEISNETLGSRKDKNDFNEIRYADMRYLGQSFEITIPYNAETYIEDFHKEHYRMYSFKNENLHVEIVTLRTKFIKKRDTIKLVKYKKEGKNPDKALIDERDFFVFNNLVKGKVYDREKLKAGNEVIGPAIITEYSSTILLPDGDICQVDEYLNLVVEIKNKV